MGYGLGIGIGIGIGIFACLYRICRQRTDRHRQDRRAYRQTGIREFCSFLAAN